MDRIKCIRLAVSSSLCLQQATELSIKSPMSLLTRALSYFENTHPPRIKNGQNFMRLKVSFDIYVCGTIKTLMSLLTRALSFCENTDPPTPAFHWDGRMGNPFLTVREANWAATPSNAGVKLGVAVHCS